MDDLLAEFGVLAEPVRLMPERERDSLFGLFTWAPPALLRLVRHIVVYPEAPDAQVTAIPVE